jgi:hypothetical protein
MKRRTRSIFLAGIFVFLILFFFRSTPVGEEVLLLTPTLTMTITHSIPHKTILPPLEPRIHLGAPQEIENGAFVFTDQFGEVTVVSIADPSAPVASWFNGTVSHLIDWNANNCELIFLNNWNIFSININQITINTNDILKSLNIPPNVIVLDFLISPDLTRFAFWYTTDNIFTNHQDIFTINQHLSYFFLDDPENEIHITDNQGYYSRSTPSVNFSRAISWSQDSTLLSYVDRDSDGVRQEFIYNLLNHSTSTVSRFTYQPGGISGGYIVSQYFSPSGQRISYNNWNPSSTPSDPTGTYIWDIPSGNLLIRLDDNFDVLAWVDDQTILIWDSDTSETLLYYISEGRFETLLAPPEYIFYGFLDLIPQTSLYSFFVFNPDTQQSQIRVMDLETREVYCLPGMGELEPLLRFEYPTYIPNSGSNDCFPVPH